MCQMYHMNIELLVSHLKHLWLSIAFYIKRLMTYSSIEKNPTMHSVCELSVKLILTRNLVLRAQNGKCCLTI